MIWHYNKDIPYITGPKEKILYVIEENGSEKVRLAHIEFDLKNERSKVIRWAYIKDILNLE